MEWFEWLILGLGIIVIIAFIILIIRQITSVNGNKNHHEEHIGYESYNPSAPNVLEEDGEVQLVAVKRLKGSSKLTGLETDSEVKKRLSKLTKEEFISLNIESYPWTKEEWHDERLSPKDIEERNDYEQEMIFAYDGNKQLNETKAKFIRRKF